MGQHCSVCGGSNSAYVDVQPAKSRKSIESLSNEKFHVVGGAKPLTPESSLIEDGESQTRETSMNKEPNYVIF